MNDFLKNEFEQAKSNNYIDDSLYKKYDVKKGLRNDDGTGVLIGLTRIADVIGYYKDKNNSKFNIPGELYYRGYSIETLYQMLQDGSVKGFEDICFLILFGHLPDADERTSFVKELTNRYELPEGFVASNILRTPSINVMNKIQRSLLMLYSEDKDADDSSPENTLIQGLSIVAKLPAISVYGYQAKAHFIENKSLYIHHLRKDYSIAQNILSLSRPEPTFSNDEVSLLDLVLILHADHGSGNNSTFANLVVASSGTDIYSAFAASVGSLKGPKHGGANITCKNMMNKIISDIGVDASDEMIRVIVHKLLNKEYFDNSGLIYGFGHAVYTISDPRAELLKKHMETVAKACGFQEKLDFYKRFEVIAKQEIKANRGKLACANVDFYSGLVFEMLNIPEDLFSPLFVCARSVGWLAHNIEEKLYSNRIIRPAGKYVGNEEDLCKK